MTENDYFNESNFVLLLCAMSDIVSDVRCEIITLCEIARMKELKLDLTGCLDSGLI